MTSIAGLPAYDADIPLADAIRARRGEIAQAMLGTAIRRQELTVGNELLALSFVDRFADALEHQTWREFYGWIDRICDKNGGAPAIARLLTQAVGVIATLPGWTGSVLATRTSFDSIAAHVRRIASRPRVSRAVSANESLDEIDVALDRLLCRLTNFDAPTADHSRAVAMWCARIAKKMGLSAVEVTFVTRAGLIHDIGKVTTPPSILNAPHRLSDPDMEIMRDHAAAGAAIISELPLLAHLTPAVRSHHERIDGQGYPDRRQGSEIPIAVRIVSVADSFNAMIGNRPYRLPMPPTVALEQLKIHRESQFDANVVRAMIEVVAPAR